MADTGYSWVVLGASFLLNMHHAGGIAAVGLFLLEFMDHFDAPTTVATSIAGLFLCTGFLFGFPIGWLCRSYGCRPVAMAASLLTSSSLILSSFASSTAMLYFSYGCLASIGFCTFFTTANIAVQQAFDKRRSFASGVVAAGVSVGTFVWPPITRWAIDVYGWRGALLLLAGVHLHSLVFAILLRTVHVSPIEKKIQFPSNKGCGQFMKKLTDLTVPIRENPAFCGYLLGILFTQAGHIIPYSLLAARAKAMNIEPTLAATLVSILGLGSGCSRAICGYIGDCKWVNRTLFSGLSGALAGMLTALSFFLTSYTQMAIYSGLYGIVIGPYGGLIGATVVDLVGLESAAPGVGYASTFMGLAQLLALITSGKLLDQFTDPAYTFLVFGVVEVLGGIIMIVTMVIRKCSRRTPKRRPLQLELKASEWT